MGTDTVDLTVIGTTVSTLMIITAKTSMTRIVTSVTGVTDRTKLSSLAALHAGRRSRPEVSVCLDRHGSAEPVTRHAANGIAMGFWRAIGQSLIAVVSKSAR